jgi:HD-GYP domain-containing protein (c-di-GMP phosphodiesterase class II)
LKPLFSLRAVIQVVLYHHENFDGTGYPSGLKGEEIPLLARIIRIVDSFDAMTTDRSYKKAVDPSCALNELIRFSGKYYDSRLVAEFVEFIREEILNQKTLSLDNKLIKCLLAE